MKNKKILISLILFLLVIFGFPVYASTKTYERTEENLRINSKINVNSYNKRLILKTPSVDASEKIYDFANLFTDSEEEDLYAQVISYINTYNLDMVIVTIDDNNKSNAQNYADDFYDYNDFGVGSTFDGILLLLDMDTREIWISTTGKAQLVYDDARINRILDYVYTPMKAKNYSKAATEFIIKSAMYAESGIPSSNENYTIDENGDYVRKPNSGEDEFPIIGIIAVCLIGTTIFVIIAASRHKTVAKATQAKEYLVKDSFKLNLKTDNFVSTYTSKTYSPQSSSSGGGSSTHHSSSGRSHGGGGRHF